MSADFPKSQRRSVDLDALADERRWQGRRRPETTQERNQRLRKLRLAAAGKDGKP